eukprot:13456759-Ditylum_brightwellii.AAC.1
MSCSSSDNTPEYDSSPVASADLVLFVAVVLCAVVGCSTQETMSVDSRNNVSIVSFCFFKGKGNFHYKVPFGSFVVQALGLAPFFESPCSG